MSCSIELKGNLVVGGSSCSSGCSPNGGAQKRQPLGFACPGTVYGGISSTDCPVNVNSPTDFVLIPGSGDLANYQFLWLQTSQAMTVRFNATGANVLGSGGTFPTGFVGGETFGWEYSELQPDGSVVLVTSVDVTFTAAAQTAQQVSNEINAAAALVGLPAVASVQESGQILLTDPVLGSNRKFTLTSGNDTIGFSDARLGFEEAFGSGCEVPVQGIFMAEFGNPTSGKITRVDVKGSGTIQVMAAGDAA